MPVLEAVGQGSILREGLCSFEAALLLNGIKDCLDDTGRVDEPQAIMDVQHVSLGCCLDNAVRLEGSFAFLHNRAQWVLTPDQIAQALSSSFLTNVSKLMYSLQHNAQSQVESLRVLCSSVMHAVGR